MPLDTQSLLNGREAGLAPAKTPHLRARLPEPRPLPERALLSHKFSVAWKEFLVRGAYHSGLLKLVRSLSRSYEYAEGSLSWHQRWKKVTQPRFLILGYHRVGVDGIPLFSTLSAEMFEAQMRFLRRNYRIISLSELSEELENPLNLEPAVVITFDDGYRDVYKNAFPLLQKYSIPATVFVTVNSIETGEVPWYDRVFLAVREFPHPSLELELDPPCIFQLTSRTSRLQAAERIVFRLRQLPEARRRDICAALEQQVHLPEEELRERMLTWDQIRTMHRAGISFASHTLTHRVISRIAPEEVGVELLESKKILEQQLGSPVRDFSYPFGQPADCGTGGREWLKAGRYSTALTTVTGINKPGADVLALRRVSLGDHQSLESFALLVSLLFLRPDQQVDRADGSLEVGPGRRQFSVNQRGAGEGHA